VRWERAVGSSSGVWGRALVEIEFNNNNNNINNNNNLICIAPVCAKKTSVAQI